MKLFEVIGGYLLLVQILFYLMNMQMAKALAELPSKTIIPSLYCTEIERIDRAERVVGPLIKIKADRIVISKKRKILYLLNKEHVLSEYPVSFGFGFLGGAKSQEGDGRTPEGSYVIDLKNSKSSYYKALRISYPNAKDVQFVAGFGVKAGGDIMIHGFPRLPIDGLIPEQVALDHLNVDWTQGCVAVTNSEIDQIFYLVDLGAKVEICPL